MNRYQCDTFRSVEAESFREAANIFGTRLARRTYGKRGVCCNVSQNAYGPGGATYQVFIGVPSRRDRSISGRNEWLIVSEVRQ